MFWEVVKMASIKFKDGNVMEFTVGTTILTTI